MTHELWASLNKKILDHLSGVSLADMVNNQEQKEQGKVVFTARNAPLDDASKEVAVNG